MSIYDDITSQAVHGEALNGRFETLRQEHVAQIAAKREAVDVAILDAERLRASLPVVVDLPPQEAHDTNSLVIHTIKARRSQRDEARKLFHAFRVRHGLTELPEEPAAALSILALALAVFIDGVINAVFFINAHLAAGPAGALLLSLMIAGTNVCLSGCAGFFAGRDAQWGVRAPDPDNPAFRRVRRKSWLRVNEYLALITIFHLLTGLVRQQETLTDLDFSFPALIAVITTPESFFLICIGICLSVFAYHKGLNGFGSYPRYSALYGRTRDCEDAVIEAYEGGCDDIREHFDAAIEVQKKEYRRRERAVALCNDAVSRAAALLRELLASIAAAEQMMQTELSNIAAVYLAVQGEREFNIDPAQLRALCSLSPIPDIELPAYVHAPDTQAFEQQCNGACDAALERLAHVFSNSGETS